MHIPDGYLGPQTYAVLDAAIIPIWAVAARQGEEDAQDQAGAAHGARGGVLVRDHDVQRARHRRVDGARRGRDARSRSSSGPWAACISVSIALVIQALLFGDGGITAIGANVFNMAVVMPFVGYYVYRLIAGDSATTRRMIVASGIAAYVSIVAGAICRRHRVRPAAAPRAHRGRAAALRSLPARGRGPRDGHRAPAVLRLGRGVRDDGRGRGAREAGQRAAREQAGGQAAALAVGGARRCSCCSPRSASSRRARRGASGAPRSSRRHLGFVPDGLEQLGGAWTAAIPDYAPAFIRNPLLGYLFAAIVGAALVIGVTWGIAQAALPRRRRHSATTPAQPRMIPALAHIGDSARERRRRGARWRAGPRSRCSTRSPRCSRTTRSPRAPGLMQRLDPRVKLLTILLFAVTASFVHSLGVLLGLVVAHGRARRRSRSSVGLVLTQGVGVGRILRAAARRCRQQPRGSRPGRCSSRSGPLSITEPGVYIAALALVTARRRRRRHRPARRVDDALDRPARMRSPRCACPTSSSPRSR